MGTRRETCGAKTRPREIQPTSAVAGDSLALVNVELAAHVELGVRYPLQRRCDELVAPVTATAQLFNRLSAF